MNNIYVALIFITIGILVNFFPWLIAGYSIHQPAAGRFTFVRSLWLKLNGVGNSKLSSPKVHPWDNAIFRF